MVLSAGCLWRGARFPAPLEGGAAPLLPARPAFEDKAVQADPPPTPVNPPTPAHLSARPAFEDERGARFGGLGAEPPEGTGMGRGGGGEGSLGQGVLAIR
ncbi:hypothetical protein GCM10018775_87210 [Streptomyces umbrinus]|nr:hypothetical protein GCM10018775_87210 [Streptomyces umbrinus]